MTRFFGHSGVAADRSDWQPLRDHLLAVAQMAARSAAPFGLSGAAFLTGLLHDVGKYAADFQRRLAGGKPVDHSTAGARIVIDRWGRSDRQAAQLAAYAILGHHAGLPDRAGGPGSFDERLGDFVAALDPAWEGELAAALASAACDRLAIPSGQPFRLATLGRLLFSCLVDADFKDTEAHFAAIEGRSIDRDWPELGAVLPQLRARFDAYMAARPQAGELNATRRGVLDHVRRGAEQPRGLFTLTVPTGGGKTLASLGFALDHAARHGLRRIVYAIPYTSIIDQTVDVFRDVFSDMPAEIVLAHHAAIEEEKPDALGARRLIDKRRLAMEDWAAPVIVTTNVQLFESLFAARPSRARKLHNLVDSVIILDEAQTLPRRLLAPTLRMIDELATTFGASVVLCTATQPAFDRRSLSCGLALEGRELAPDPAGLARRLRRATIRDAGPLDDNALVAALAEEPQALTIVNSRRHALELYRAGLAARLDGLVHLSTRQCAAHRRDVLADIRARLRGGAACRVVATSLVEAGVDLDFPKVWRARAGLEQIVQAAGRCNREGRRAAEASPVTVFDAPDHAPPAEIAGLIEDMRRMSAHDDLLSPAAIEAYFREVYWRLGPALDAEKILAGFSISVLSGADFAYRTVADKYRMIDSGMAAVIAPWDARARAAIDRLAVEAIPSGTLARALQPYIVQVPPRIRRALIDNRHVAFAAPQMRGEQFAVLRTESLYQADVGLLWESAEYVGDEMQIIG